MTTTAGRRAPSDRRTHREGLLFLALVVLAWGLTWPVNKVVLQSMSPFWMAAVRSAIATVAIFGIAIARGRLIVPPRGDLPVLVSITLLHMVGFVVLANIGLQFVPTGRSVVLAYTTPLWHAPGGRLFRLRQAAVARRSGAGIWLGDQANAWELGHDRPAAVRRSVIDDDDLIIGVRLGGHRGEGPAKIGSLVVERDDDADFHGPGASVKPAHAGAWPRRDHDRDRTRQSR
jgi:hypothetical protein